MTKVNFPVAVSDFFKSNGFAHPGVDAGGPSLTRQEFAEECDINSIMKRYEGVGGGPGGLPRHDALPPFYADFTTVPSNLMEYMQLMQDAENAFMMLPAVVRKEFDNSPMAFVDFASDPGNVDQMRKWGLAPVPVQDPQPVADSPAAVQSPPAPPALAGAPVPARPAPVPAPVSGAPTHGSS